ncbi:MAG TPA: hypothetical protein VK538_02045 [Solirubrobacteraceae bacterium]|nr:hypothetical protein [Solirubrobacteraceae bacterium]
MATRTIVTSQPDVACDVCERRLLRGEQHELFVAAGRPRTVCELCAPRAAHQGWQRESDRESLSPAPLRTGRGRNLFERLRQVGRSAAAEPAPAGEWREREPQPYDFFDGAGAEAGSHAELGRHAPRERAHAADAAPPALDESSRAPADGPLENALAVFNAGEYPRRVASLTRSLGVPEVTVRPGVAVASSIVIVVAWELCWYTYEVDLDDMQGPEARAIAQGTELSELGEEDRLANARADERGALAVL